jgi:hypothetical protein
MMVKRIIPTTACHSMFIEENEGNNGIWEVLGMYDEYTYMLKSRLSFLKDGYWRSEVEYYEPYPKPIEIDEELFKF